MGFPNILEVENEGSNVTLKSLSLALGIRTVYRDGSISLWLSLWSTDSNGLDRNLGLPASVK